MKVKFYTICILIAVSLGWNVQAQELDAPMRPSVEEGVSLRLNPDLLQISVLTCGPGTKVYELFGHSALRAKYTGRERKFDVVYNYGMFSFDTPNFIWRFTKGETDYNLGVNEYKYFLFEYASRGSRVDEQILNLTAEQKLALLDALNENALPENREYRYNFLFDNCATRPRDMIEQVLGGVDYQEPTGESPTFREEIHRYAARCPWMIFGIDLALGAELDRPMTYREQMFAPEILRQAFAQATVQGDDGRPLVAQSRALFIPEHPALPDKTPFCCSPLFIAWLLLALVVALSVYDIRRKRCSRWADSALYTLYGLGGIIIFILMFFSEHPATSVNYSAMWLHPLWLFMAVAIWFNSLKNVVRYYHFANFALLLLFVLLWHWLPQQFNAAFFPLVLILIVRSATYLQIEWRGKKVEHIKR